MSGPRGCYRAGRMIVLWPFLEYRFRRVLVTLAGAPAHLAGELWADVPEAVRDSISEVLTALAEAKAPRQSEAARVVDRRPVSL